MLQSVDLVAQYYERRRVGFGADLGASRAREDGVAFTHEAYANGAPGVRKSLTEMARLMREARNDKDVNGYAADVLTAAGLDGRNKSSWTVRNIVQALLDNVRAVVIYSPDPNGTEMITSPAGQLCLRPGLCIRKEDCDGLTTLLGALCLCVGLSVRICKQSWGSNVQEHVLLAVEDENGHWLKCDPSHPSLPVGRGVSAHSEEFYNPMDADPSIKVGGGAEIVTFGALPGVGRGGGGGGGGHGGGGGGGGGHGGGGGGGGHGGGHGGGGGGHGGGGGGHHGGGGHVVVGRGGRGGRRRFFGGQWWGWDGANWIVATDFGCLQWGSPITNPEAGLLALARSYAAELPSSDAYNGTTYLFSQENGVLVIRPCIAWSGVGRAVNSQLAPSRGRRRDGLGGFISDDQIKALVLETSSIMDQTDNAVGQCYGAGSLSAPRITVWRGVYSSWRTDMEALQTCIEDLVPSAHTQCLPYYDLSDGWTQAQSLLLGYQKTSSDWQKEVQGACTWYVPPPLPVAPIPGPVGPPQHTWRDDLKTAGYVIGGVLVVGTVAYATSQVVKLASLVKSA